MSIKDKAKANLKDKELTDVKTEIAIARYEAFHKSVKHKLKKPSKF